MDIKIRGMFKQYQEFINSIFSINRELLYRVLGYSIGLGYWILTILVVPFFSLILVLNELGNLFSYILNVILVVVYTATWIMYRDDSLQYREVSVWRLVVLSLIFHFMCFIPFIFLMYLRGHL